MTPGALVTAAWVLPLDAPPIRGGAVAVRGGLVAAVGPRRDVEATCGDLARRDAGGIVLPALANAHTHLDLTGLAPAADLPSSTFLEWARNLGRTLAGLGPGAFEAAVRRGVADSRRAGVGLVGDHASRGVPASAREGIEAVILEEDLFGRPGTTPHAPYSCPPDRIRRLASAGGLLSIHAAESPEEVEFFATGGGPLEAALRRLGAAVPEVRGTTPVAFLDSLGAVGPRTILVHMTHATDADLDLVASRGATVALCPRTAERFCSRADTAGMRRRGIRIVLGTDSTATAPDLDLRAEARAACDLYGWRPAEALRAIGPDAADALGRPRRGRLAPGAAADLVVVEADAASAAGAEEAALAAPIRFALEGVAS